MVFDIPPRGTAVKLQETLDSHKVAICELEAQGGRMVSTDEEGNITLWQSGGHFTEIIKIDGKGLVVENNSCYFMKCKPAENSKNKEMTRNRAS